MMLQYKTLFLVNFAETFSKASQKPAQSLTVKVGLALAVAVMISRVTAKMVDKTELPVDIPLRVVCIIITGLAFIVSGLLLLVTHSSYDAYQNSFARMTRLMPLPRAIRYLLQLAPGILVSILLVIVSFGVLRSVASGVRQSFVVLEACWICGVFSGLGLQFVAWLSSRMSKVTYFIAATTTVVVGLERIYSSDHLFVINYVPYLLIAVMILPVIGLVHQYVLGYQPRLSLVNQNHAKLLPEFLPFKAWIFVKLWRNTAIRNSFLATVLLSGLMAVTIVLRHKLITDTYPILLFCALLASTFSTEIRGVVRRYMPPESVLLSGAKSLIGGQLSAVYVASVVIGLPLFFSVNGQATDSNQLAITFLSMLAYAVAAGQFVGAVLMPSSGEVGTQFFASLLAGSLVTFFPKYTHIADMSFGISTLTWLTGAVMWSVLVYVTEIVRRRNYGRAR